MASPVPRSDRALDVVTLGEAMTLLLAEPGLPLRAAGTFRRGLAGAEANVAVGLARLGHRVGWIGRLGDDALGSGIVHALRGEGVDVTHVRTDPDAPTGVLVRDAHSAGATEVVYARAGSAGGRLSASDVPASYVAGARVLLLTGITPLLSESARSACEAAAAAARDAGVLVAVDPNLRRRLASPERARDVVRPMVLAADVVLAGEDELAVLELDPSDLPARLVVVKRGAEGAWATDGSARWEAAALAVPCVDPVGAGDAFNAGLLSALLRGGDGATALTEGAAVAACVVQVPGDQDGLPTPRERDAQLAGRQQVLR